MSTSLQQKPKDTAMSLPENLQGSWGSEGVDNADILIPRLLLMQGQSEAVLESKAKMGDIIRSTTEEVVGTKEKPMPFIPILTYKTFITLEKVGNKFEFRSIEPITSENVHAPLEWQQGGSLWRRDKSLDFFVLLPGDIERERKTLDKLKAGDIPDTADALFPCHLSFRRTSYSAGKVLATHFSTAARFKLPPASKIFSLSSEIVKNDQGTYSVFTVEATGKTSIDDLTVAKKWYDILSTARAKVVVDEPEV